MIYPAELQLLAFFGVEPVLDDDIWLFAVSDANGCELALSFNTSDNSLQTSICFMGKTVASVCHEGMTRLWIDNNVLCAEFTQNIFKTCVTVKTCPDIDVRWSSLRVQ